MLEDDVGIRVSGRTLSYRNPHYDDDESLVFARSPRLQKLLKKSRASIEAGKGLSSTEFWKAVSKRKARCGA